LPESAFPTDSSALQERWKMQPPAEWNPAVVAALVEKPFKTLTDVSQVYGKLFEATAANLKKRSASETAPMDDPLQETLRTAFFKEGAARVVKQGRGGKGIWAQGARSQNEGAG
jgi:hypothetical protein